MNGFIFRARPLKSGYMRTSYAGADGLMQGAGIGSRMVKSPVASEYFTTFWGWTADQWALPFPGVYRLVRIADGGGGGAAGATTAPGFVNNGYGGKAGAVSDGSVTLRAAVLIRIGRGGAGGVFSGSIGAAGNTGWGVTVSGVGSPPAAGAGGTGGSPGNSATEPQRLGQAGPAAPGGFVSPTGRAWGSGGDGGNATLLDGNRGTPGHVYLELVG